jgi:DnaJ-class molecular chaperone
VQKLPPNHHQKGNHFVTIKIIIPKKLNEQQRIAMEAFAKVEDPAPQPSVTM